MVPFSEKSEEGVHGRKASIRSWVLNLMCLAHANGDVNPTGDTGVWSSAEWSGRGELFWEPSADSGT